MRHVLRMFVLIALIVPATDAGAQDYMQEIRFSIWPHHNFQHALNLINQHRPEATAPAILELDVYKGVCYCGLGQYNESVAYFDWVLRAYRTLSPEVTTYVNECRMKCGEDDAEFGDTSPAVIAFASPTTPPGPAVISGKEFYEDTREWDEVTVERILSPEEYQERIYRQYHPDSIKQQLDELNIHSSAIDATEHFIVVMPEYLKDSTRASEIGQELERALAFLTEFYGLKVPPGMITVYSCGDMQLFHELARRLHGLHLHSRLIGYSSHPDLSMVAYNPGRNAGTFKHELTHILFNQNVPYLEPWLAEGIPALYEVSRFRADSLYGISAWRDEALSQMGDQAVMDLSRLLAMDWSEFEAWESPEYNSRSKACVARTFVLYLQEVGKLKEVFAAYRDQDPVRYDPYAVTGVLGGEMDDIQSRFMSWFEQLH